MLWKTHIRIANKVLFKLGISKSSVEANRLREGSVTPDKWKDFPHHHGKSGKIKKYVLEARRLFLNDDLAEAVFVWEYHFIISKIPTLHYHHVPDITFVGNNK